MQGQRRNLKRLHAQRCGLLFSAFPLNRITVYRIVLMLLALAWDTMAQAQSGALLPDLNSYVKSRLQELAAIPPDRRERLDGLADFIRTQLASRQTVRLVFICTHNSRRSQSMVLSSSPVVLTKV